jgi:hypothetical protein
VRIHLNDDATLDDLDVESPRRVRLEDLGANGFWLEIVTESGERLVVGLSADTSIRAVLE